MKQRKPMNRGTGFARKVPERKPRAPLVPPAEPSRAVLRMVDHRARLTVMPKENPVQSEAYMRVVRQLPCMHCGHPAPSQFCHSDEGKGAGIKSDCREGWPGCGPRIGEPGCHHLVGTQRIYPKQERRRIEADMATRTRARIKQLGLWPASLEWYE
jgi:hypothetical protein